MRGRVVLPGDPVYDRFLHDEFARATDLFLEQGVVVLWLLAPQIDIGRNELAAISGSVSGVSRSSTSLCHPA